MAQETGCRVTGVDIHQAGVDAANTQAEALGLADRARFVRADTRRPLPFGDATFDALTCIDSFNHLYEREQVLREWHRVLRSNARMLFTDPITVTGPIRREEMIVRSGSMGEFVFTPPGVDDQRVRSTLGDDEWRTLDPGRLSGGGPGRTWWCGSSRAATPGTT